MDLSLISLYSILRSELLWESLLSFKDNFGWNHCYIKWRVCVHIRYPRRQSQRRRKLGKLISLSTFVCITLKFTKDHSHPSCFLCFVTVLYYFYLNFFLMWFLCLILEKKGQLAFRDLPVFIMRCSIWWCGIFMQVINAWHSTFGTLWLDKGQCENCFHV